jgi:DNA-binding response OmpR family regulator
MASRSESSETDENAPGRGAELRVLLVDDDDDTRDLLRFVLVQDGYLVDDVQHPESALEHLRKGGYRLVVTDYDLPGKTGAQLLRQATRERLLEGCAVLVVTAHSDPEDVGTAPVIHKPLDVEAFRRQVRGILETHGSAPVSGGKGAPAGAPAVTIVLYVHRDTPASRRAERNARQILGRIGEASVRFELRDVAEHQSEAEADRIVFVPTVVVKCTPPVWIVGDLRQPHALFDVLCMCGLARFGEFE